ncbi:MAG: tRNA threonylcarbamoyladenosine dehydratase [Bacteroidota bacterium]
MNTNWQERTELLLGRENVKNLQSSNVLVCGLGGVGAVAAEMICRAGVGKMTIIDNDIIHDTNLNRQTLALKSTLGKSKTQLMKDRLLDINPQLEINCEELFLVDEKIQDILLQSFDYVVDAIDTLTPKIFLIYHTLQKGYPLVSSMGAGGKLDPSRVFITDIAQTYNCNLARLLRKRLKNMGVKTGFKTIFSPELVPEDSLLYLVDEPNKKTTVGTISYMPAIFGSVAASVVIRDLLQIPVYLTPSPYKKNR